MLIWIVSGVIAVIALATVVVAVFRGGDAPAVVRTAPGWVVPTPEQVRAVESFPLAWQGYEPVEVDTTMVALADAYERLYRAADPATLDRATRGVAATHEAGPLTVPATTDDPAAPTEQA